MGRAMFSFFAPPTQNIKYLKAKRKEIHFDYDEIMHEAHHTVFTVAKITKLDLLNDIQNSLTSAMKSGVPYESWRNNIKNTLIKKGWYGRVVAQNPHTGEQKEIYVGNRRLKNIYETNLSVAAAKSAYEVAIKAGAKYIRYLSILDAKTRPAHRAMHGIIKKIDDPWWNINYPKNGWGCRCDVMFLWDEDLKENGWNESVGTLPNVAEKDWDYHVGKGANLDEIYKQKLANLQDGKFKHSAKIEFANLEHERNLYVWQRGLDEAIGELLIKKNVKSPINAFQIGSLREDIIKRSSEILDIELKNSYIMGDKNGILHIRDDRKSAYNQALRIDELKKIVQILADKNTPASIDTKNKNIIFWFDDELDEAKINKIVVDLNYTLKKFGVTNYMVTAGKVKKKDELGRKEYIKIR